MKFFRCPCRDEQEINSAASVMNELGPYDHWRVDDTCSFCGSVKSSKFIRDLESGVEFIPYPITHGTLYLPKEGSMAMKITYSHLSDSDRARLSFVLRSYRFHGEIYARPSFCPPFPNEFNLH